MDFVVANLAASPIRRVRWKGKEWLVAPMTMIVEGVLNGSQGPLAYFADDIKASAAAWDGMPLTANHPMSEYGSPIPAAYAKHLHIGMVRKPVFAGDRLRAEGWFDVELTKNVDSRIISALEAGQPIELSTGLQTANENTPGTLKGRAYHAIARAYRPDHLAILMDSIGACSVSEHGCGVLNHEGEDMSTPFNLDSDFARDVLPDPDDHANEAGLHVEQPLLFPKTMTANHPPGCSHCGKGNVQNHGVDENDTLDIPQMDWEAMSREGARD